MTKELLRKAYKEKRMLFSPEELTRYSEEICARLLSVFPFESTYVHLFLPIEKHREVNTFPLIDSIRARGGNVVVSKTHWETNEMSHILWEESTKLSLNPWGIPEPTAGVEVLPDALDLVLIPLLVCDERGFRVGYGKGFYDRFLAECSSSSTFVGLNFFEPCSGITDLHADDIPLHQLITPQKHFYFEQ